MTASVFGMVTGLWNRMSAHLMIAGLELSDVATSRLNVNAKKHVRWNVQLSKPNLES